ncbi:MAG: transporter, partial [Gammaproteobacteria bacterium]|nr:transporter [Gammaproteobacteria bacterium]
MSSAVLYRLYLLPVLFLALPGMTAGAPNGPLTLAAALATVSDRHPRVAEERAALSLAEAESRAVAAEDDLRIGISLEGRVIEPNPVAEDQSSADSTAVVYARKRLY